MCIFNCFFILIKNKITKYMHKNHFENKSQKNYFHNIFIINFFQQLTKTFSSKNDDLHFFGKISLEFRIRI